MHAPVRDDGGGDGFETKPYEGGILLRLDPVPVGAADPDGAPALQLSLRARPDGFTSEVVPWGRRRGGYRRWRNLRNPLGRTADRLPPRWDDSCAAAPRPPRVAPAPEEEATPRATFHSDLCYVRLGLLHNAPGERMRLHARVLQDGEHQDGFNDLHGRWRSLRRPVVQPTRVRRGLGVHPMELRANACLVYLGWLHGTPHAEAVRLVAKVFQDGGHLDGFLDFCGRWRSLRHPVYAPWEPAARVAGAASTRARPAAGAGTVKAPNAPG